jgi:hypothetical protein
MLHFLAGPATEKFGFRPQSGIIQPSCPRTIRSACLKPAPRARLARHADNARSRSKKFAPLKGMDALKTDSPGSHHTAENFEDDACKMNSNYKNT